MNKENPLSSVSFVEIDAEYAGQRLDNYLLRILKGVPKSHVYRLLRKGEVRVNKGRARPERKLEGGDIIRLPPIRVSEPSSLARQPLPEALARTLEDAVIWQGQGLICLNKPAGMAAHGGTGIQVGVIEALRRLWPEKPFLELVHRLDRDTSGCLLLAETRSALLAAQEAWQQDRVEKNYQALLAGRWQGGGREVDQALARTLQRKDARLVCIDEQGKDARTFFTPIKRYAQATLVNARITTGRTHQIRVHAAYLGHPIAGDRHYGNFSFNRIMKGHGVSRLFLHAKSLTLPGVDPQQRLYIKAPLDKEFEDVLKYLEHFTA